MREEIGGTDYVNAPVRQVYDQTWIIEQIQVGSDEIVHAPANGCGNQRRIARIAAGRRGEVGLGKRGALLDQAEKLLRNRRPNVPLNCRPTQYGP